MASSCFEGQERSGFHQRKEDTCSLLHWEFPSLGLRPPEQCCLEGNPSTCWISLLKPCHLELFSCLGHLAIRAALPVAMPEWQHSARLVLLPPSMARSIKVPQSWFPSKVTQVVSITDWTQAQIPGRLKMLLLQHIDSIKKFAYFLSRGSRTAWGSLDTSYLRSLSLLWKEHELFLVSETQGLVLCSPLIR